MTAVLETCYFWVGIHCDMLLYKYLHDFSGAPIATSPSMTVTVGRYHRLARVLDFVRRELLNAHSALGLTYTRSCESRQEA